MDDSRSNSTTANGAAASSDASRPLRDARGHFLPGNTFGFKKGNKLAARISPASRRARSNRLALLSEITPGKVRLVANSLFRRALNGDTKAAELIFRYGIGPAMNLDIVERLRAMEESLGIDSPTQSPDSAELPEPIVDYHTDGDGNLVIKRRPMRLNEDEPADIVADAEATPIDDEGASA